MKLGFSLYLSSGMEKNIEIIHRAKKANMMYAFTSLHIPEESQYTDDAINLIKLCKNENIKLMVDISPHGLEKYNLGSYEELRELGVEYLRPDFGFTNKEIIRLSKIFHIVFNASTAVVDDLDEMQREGVDFSRFLGCHNFYPKPLTGISIERVKEVNEYLHSLKIMTMAFVPGDVELRRPLFEGLPTVEKHRGKDVFLSLLELEQAADTDVALIGDIDVSERTWNKLEEYSNGIIALSASVDAEFDYIKNVVFHERVDCSEYVVRLVESRKFNKKVSASKPLPRPKGTIFISNENFLRYEGEVEIARVDLAPDHRVCVIGHVDDSELEYLSYIKGGGSFVLRS
ncbi:MAG: MupG family TIM beta-alpha barrel fold protein [Oscillospiraceae bacterium]|nr:MupG family TIM beta-alpha barrel fold protein [Oscillospiraceae bacterium]MCL2279985.1 MupG family TIM beta-alpha barrel fold protein [Oscillospiraceae bacterium]